MIRIGEGAGAVVAGDAKTAVAAFDDALLSGARMCVSVLEASQGTDVPIGQTQRVLRSMASGIQSVVDGRGEIVAAVHQLTVIKGRSNLREHSYGCPDGWEELASLAPALRPEPVGA